MSVDVLVLVQSEWATPLARYNLHPVFGHDVLVDMIVLNLVFCNNPIDVDLEIIRGPLVISVIVYLHPGALLSLYRILIRTDYCLYNYNVIYVVCPLQGNVFTR